METSKMFRLNLLDVGKAAIVATLSPVIPIVENSFTAGSFVMNWHNIGIAAASGFFAYIVKNFFTPSSSK